MIGILVTVLVQSSSTSTSIIISLVGGVCYTMGIPVGNIIVRAVSYPFTLIKNISL